MKIGLVIYGSLETVSGGYFYDRRLVEGLRAAGDEVQILSLPWRGYASHLTDNLRFRLPPGLDLLIQDELNHPSLLAANNGPHLYPVISLVHHLRCSEARPAWQNIFYRGIERRYLRSADGFIFNSRTTRASVEALSGDARPSIVAYPPTDRFGAALSESDIRARAALPGPLRLLFLGNVIPRKGLHTLLSALAQLPPGSADLEVVGSLTADRAYARKIRRQVAALELVPWVRLRGALDEAAVRAQLQNAQVLAVPSSYEGYGMAYLEGMGFGLPAIGTTAGAASEIITDGQDGFLIQPGDVESLAVRLERLAGDRKSLASMSLAARRRYQAQPGWEKTCGEIRRFLVTLQKV
jgi:glycosyltransferase involved in cell wall biosynthesis